MGITYPPNDIVKKFIKEKNTPFQELDFVCFIDSSERNNTNYLATEEDFSSLQNDRDLAHFSNTDMNIMRNPQNS